jgi:hypothetical protein
MPPTDPEIVALSEAWLWYQADMRHKIDADEGENFWAVDALIELCDSGDTDRIWSAILDLCARADGKDPRVLAAIGAGPLEDFVVRFGDQAMDLVEPELDENETLLRALAGVWRWDAPIRARIDRVLAAHGQELL